MADRRVWSHNETLDFINTATKFKLVEESDSKKIEMKLFFGMYAETWRNGDIISPMTDFTYSEHVNQS